MKDFRRHQKDDRPPRRDERTPAHRPLDERGSAGIDRELVYGVEPIRELIAAAPQVVRALFVRRDEERRFAEQIERVRAAGGRIEMVEAERLAQIAGTEARHQGIAAMMREFEYAAVEDLIAAQADPLVLVDGVTDPRNLGALMRSAEGAGVNAIVLAKDRTVGITPAAVKSSAGAWIHLKIARCGNVARTLEEFKEAGYWIAALAPGGETSIYNLDTTRKLVVVVGSEGSGIRDIVRKNSDFIVSIPMRGRVGSLNVSVASALALYEISRRRTSSANT
ncbi:MAG TPA: 23S rRNA (guanosine(2251)-2'-O)-methyltransferase RlmB [Candidatus Binataceae bacterium]|nr:23S rRNA (guanosine(2251)-2'-O)-methyltransferase RlmB [Candidatus Binataceae bacterium]